MSLKDEALPSAVELSSPQTVVPISTVTPDTCVHHFDQLDDDTQHALVDALVSGRLNVNPQTSRLARGDVVVFTEYFRVE